MWTRRLSERIQQEILAMHGHRDVYRTVGKIVSEHGALPPHTSSRAIRQKS